MGDGVAHAITVAVALDVQGLVEVHRAGRIDRAEGHRRLVPVHGQEGLAQDPFGFGEHLRRELPGDTEFLSDRGIPGREGGADVTGCDDLAGHGAHPRQRP